MLSKTPRWLLLLEAALLLGALLVLAYKAAMRVLPLPGMAQTARARKVDPQTQILRYYRDFPDRYIRITKESFRYEERTRSGLHTFTLKNTATVPYHEIEMRFDYGSAAGKVLHTHTARIAGTLPALGTMTVTDLKVKSVPAEGISVVTSVAKAAPLAAIP